MTGVLFDIKRFAVHDGPGIRVTAFMKGCPLGCKWCHNPESVSPAICTVDKHVRIGDKVFTDSEKIGYEITPEALVKEFAKERVFMEESGGGVTFSGGEPLLQAEFLTQTLRMCREEGFHTAVDTSGFAAQLKLEWTIPYTDLYLFDIKMIGDDEHKKYTGVSNVQIHNNLRFLLRKGKKVRIRMPMIPEATMTEDNISRAIDFLRTLPEQIEGIDLLPFHNIARHKYVRFRLDNPYADVKSLAKSDLQGIKQRFESANFVVCC
ncbi:MAG: glycyl-radical enzyme activating protein [Tannerella sp.]|jgi:pyruvate formate lyase activating enzyme|nr:glycyl-radical enzyme activating protein [Tannerella sp.]